MSPTPAHSPAPLSGVRLCLLLAGGQRTSELVAESGFSLLDFTLTPTRTLLGLWIERLVTLPTPDQERLEVRIVHDERTPGPVLEADPGPLRLQVRQESRSYRGPAGVVKDECATLDPNDTVLVIEAQRLPWCPIAPLLQRHDSSGAQITVGCNPDRTTAGVYALRAGTLSLIPGNGFMDLKEQWLQKALNAGHDVRVHTFPEPGITPIRTREQLLDAARRLNGLPDPLASIAERTPAPEHRGPFDRSVLSESSTIAPGAVVIDSVVMEYATVGAGALVVRSLVCPRAVVPSDATVVDSVVGPGAVHLSGTARGARSGS